MSLVSILAGFVIVAFYFKTPKLSPEALMGQIPKVESHAPIENIVTDELDDLLEVEAFDEETNLILDEIIDDLEG